MAKPWFAKASPNGNILKVYKNPLEDAGSLRLLCAKTWSTLLHNHRNCVLCDLVDPSLFVVTIRHLHSICICLFTYAECTWIHVTWSYPTIQHTSAIILYISQMIYASAFAGWKPLQIKKFSVETIVSICCIFLSGVRVNMSILYVCVFHVHSIIVWWYGCPTVRNCSEGFIKIAGLLQTLPKHDEIDPCADLVGCTVW